MQQYAAMSGHCIIANEKAYNTASVTVTHRLLPVDILSRQPHSVIATDPAHVLSSVWRQQHRERHLVTSEIVYECVSEEASQDQEWMYEIKVRIARATRSPAPTSDAVQNGITQ